MGHACPGVRVRGYSAPFLMRLGPSRPQPELMTIPAPGPQTRLMGLDLARFLAIAGMVFVHARDVLAGHVASSEPWALMLLQSVTTNRARLLFFMLAGVGTALLVSKREQVTSLLLRRAAFLTIVGAALVLMGWEDLVLVFYGVLFVCAAVLVRLPGRGLLAVIVLVGAPGVVRRGLDPSADDTLTNVLLVVGELVPLFCLGMLIGRLDLTRGRTVRSIAVAGALLALPGLIVLTMSGGLDITEVHGRLEPAAALTSTAGLCLVVLASCLWIAGVGRGWLRPLVATGRMPLSAYVAHALVFTLIAGVTDLGLGLATTAAAVYLVATVGAAAWWARRHRSGPLEALMRRTTGGPTTPANGYSGTQSRP